MLDKIYGIDAGIINLVKNELTKDIKTPIKEIYNKALNFFPEEDIDIIMISDLVYHLVD